MNRATKGLAMLASAILSAVRTPQRADASQETVTPLHRATWIRHCVSEIGATMAPHAHIQPMEPSEPEIVYIDVGDRVHRGNLLYDRPETFAAFVRESIAALITKTARELSPDDFADGVMWDIVTGRGEGWTCATYAAVECGIQERRMSWDDTLRKRSYTPPCNCDHAKELDALLKEAENNLHRLYARLDVGEDQHISARGAIETLKLQVERARLFAESLSDGPENLACIGGAMADALDLDGGKWRPPTAEQMAQWAHTVPTESIRRVRAALAHLADTQLVRGSAEYHLIHALAATEGDQ